MGKKSKPSRQAQQLKLNNKKEHPIITVLFVILICVAIGLRFSNLNIPHPKRTLDEEVYTKQANRIADKGILETRQLIKEYINDSSLWTYPPPTRIGYDYLLAAVMKISTIHTEMAGAYISVFASLGTLLILVIMGLRFFNQWVTLIALVAMSVSPMDLAIARRCWQDGLLAFCGILYIYICAELANNLNRRILYIPLLVVGITCMLIKESGIIIFALGILWLLYQAVLKRKSTSAAILTMIIGLAGLAGSFIILGLVAGGFSNILETFKDIKEAMPRNLYAIMYQTGPWYKIIEGFWMLTPFFTVVVFASCITTFMVCLCPRLSSFQTLRYISERKIIAGLAFFISSFLIITTITPYCQNIRYMSVIYVPFYLFSGLGLWLLARLVKEKFGNFPFFAVTAIIIIAIIGAVIHDYQTFKYIFIEKGAADLSVRYLQENSNK